MLVAGGAGEAERPRIWRELGEYRFIWKKQERNPCTREGYSAGDQLQGNKRYSTQEGGRGDRNV